MAWKPDDQGRHTWKEVDLVEGWAAPLSCSFSFAALDDVALRVRVVCRRAVTAPAIGALVQSGDLIRILSIHPFRACSLAATVANGRAQAERVAGQILPTTNDSSTQGGKQA